MRIGESSLFRGVLIDEFIDPHRDDEFKLISVPGILPVDGKTILVNWDLK